MAAGGSVWNANNWHWEEKECTKVAIEKLTSLLENRLLQDGVVLKNVKVSGEASVSVRKQRHILSVDFNINAQWIVQSASQILSSGKIDIRDIDADNCKDEDYDIFVTCDTENDETIRLKESLRKGVASREIKSLLKDFISEFEKHVSNAEKLENEKKNKEQELRRMQEAEEAKSGEQIKLLQEAKDLDSKKRDSAIQIAASSSANQPTGKGSVWNVNSYHWEEKQLSKWAIQRIQTIFSESTQITLQCAEHSAVATVSFFNCTVTGEASVTIRKMKKVTIFELEIKGDWKATLRSKDRGNKFLADSSGGFCIPEFSSELNFDECSINFTGDSTHPTRVIILDLMKQCGSSEMRSLLKRFTKDLEAQG